MSTPFVQSQIASFERLESSLAGRESATQTAARRGSFERFLREGLPTTRQERWKYTSLRAVEQRRFESEQVDITTDGELTVDELPGCDGPRVVFANGRFSIALSRLGALPEGLTLSHATASADTGSGRAADSVSALTGAFAAQVVTLRIQARLATPILIVHLGAARAFDVAAHSRLEIRLDDGAEATLVEHFLGHGTHSNLATQLLTIDVSRNARLQHVRLQDESAGATLLSRTVASVSGTLESTEICLGAALSRHEFSVDLVSRSRLPRFESGAGSASRDISASLHVGSDSKPRFNSRGVFALRGRQHADLQLSVTHQTGDSSSDLLWRGIADGRSRGVFSGAITIQVGADGSAAKLSNKNLLLSEHAEIDTQPVLEIFADEVKASHGATVGQLDERALFYLRSRGLPLEEARLLLTYAFCREVLDGIAPLALREHLAKRLVEHLPQKIAADADTLQPFIPTAAPVANSPVTL